MDQKEFREFYRTIQDVAEHPVVLRMKKYPHHGDDLAISIVCG